MDKHQTLEVFCPDLRTEPIIFHTQREHANHCTTEVVFYQNSLLNKAEREVLCKFVTSLQFTTNYKGYVQNDNEFPFNFKKGTIVKVSSSHIHSVTNVW